MFLLNRSQQQHQCYLREANDKMWQVRKQLTNINNKELEPLIQRLDQDLKEAHAFFNKEINHFILKKNKLSFTQYYADYVKTVENILNDPLHASEIAQDFMNDERLHQLSISEKRCAKVVDSLATLCAVTACVAALAAMTAMVTLALSPAMLPLGIMALVFGTAALCIAGVSKLEKQIPVESLSLTDTIIPNNLEQLVEFETKHMHSEDSQVQCH